MKLKQSVWRDVQPFIISHRHNNGKYPSQCLHRDSIFKSIGPTVMICGI